MKKLLAALFMAATLSVAHAQTWPTKTVRIIVPSPLPLGSQTASV